MASRRRGGRMSMRAFDRMLTRKVVAITESQHVHRFHVHNKTIATGNNQMQLLKAIDDPDYDVGGDFGTAAECETGSKIVKIDINLIITAGDAGKAHELMLLKNPDQLLTSTDPHNLFTQDLTAINSMLRKSTLKYTRFVQTSNKDMTFLKLRIRRGALMRNRLMKDLDSLDLIITNSNGAANLILEAWGKIVTRK